MEKTHYRKAFNSPYLSSADIVEPTVLTIKFVKLEPDKTKKTKDHFNTAYFVETEIRPSEKLKPMILNAGNSRTLKDLTGSAFIDDWQDVSVSIYVDHNVRFGNQTMDGLRINPKQPQRKPELLPANKDEWEKAIKSYKIKGSLDGVLKHRVISQANIALIIKQSEEPENVG